MSCTSCGSTNSNCSCSDNCPNKTSDITVFDGILNTLEVPCGASLNDILALLEAYTTNMVNELDGMISVTVAVNPYGLAPGVYSIQQVVNAITTYLNSIVSYQVYVDVTKTGANTLLATPTGGVAPYTYQWFIQDSRAQISISGSSTSASVTLTPTIASSDALVKVRITDANGRKTNDCYYIRITT